MDNTITSRALPSSFPTISVGELKKLSPTTIGKNIIGFSVDGWPNNKFCEALSYHGLYGQQIRHNGTLLVKLDLNIPKHQIALNQLKKNNDDTYRVGVGKYGFGPEPILLTSNINDAIKAQNSLQQGSVSKHEAKTLLDWVIQKTRNALMHSNDDPYKQKNSSPLEYSGACGYGQGIVGHQCENIGIHVKYHQVASLSNFSRNRHAFNVVTLPVQDSKTGKTQDRHYLIDTTFRQFFDCETHGINANSTIKSWGAILTETKGGRELADAILKHGFVELTEETARLYVESQIAIKNEETAHYDAAVWETNSALAALTKQSTIDNDYDLEELNDVDIKSPKEHQTPSSFCTQKSPAKKSASIQPS